GKNKFIRWDGIADSQVNAIDIFKQFYNLIHMDLPKFILIIQQCIIAKLIRSPIVIGLGNKILMKVSGILMMRNDYQFKQLLGCIVFFQSFNKWQRKQLMPLSMPAIFL